MKEILHYYKAWLFLPLVLFLSYAGHAQDQQTLEFKIQIHEPDSITGDNVWGVYVKPTSGFVDGQNGTVTASGQISILMSDGVWDGLPDSLYNIESVNGSWNDQYDVVRSPTEAPGVSYYFIGLDDEGDGIPLENGEETLLFTFQSWQDCPDTLGLIENAIDPFDEPGRGGSNSEGNNPGMDLAVFNTNTGQIHNWEGNYQPRAFDCEDCDGDGIANGIEDSNGNGVFDAVDTGMGVDSSDMCDACYPLGIINFEAELTGGDTLSVCADQDSAQLVVTTTGGLEPYTVYVHTTDVNAVEGQVIFTDYRSGDTVKVFPMVTTTYTLDSIIDSLGCALVDPSALTGSVLVSVEGPLGWGAGGNIPADWTSCTLDTLFFEVDATNQGDAEILYQWQVSKNGEFGDYADIANGTPYSLAETDSLVISNPEGLDGFFYKAKIFTETCDTLYSEAAQLVVDGPFVINSGPVDAAICGIDVHEFTADTENLGSGSIVKEWQVNTGTGWQIISDATAYGGFSTDTLMILNPAMDVSSLDSNWYRLRITGANMICEEVFTDSARLRVEGPLTIRPENMPKDTAACIGTVACFGVFVDNPGSGTLEYQWYARPTSTDPWFALTNDGNVSGVMSDTMCIADAENYDNYQFEVRINSTECSNINTSDLGAPATLTVAKDITFDVDPQSESICAGDLITFTVDINTEDSETDGTWQVSADSGATWIDLVASSIYSGVTTSGGGLQTLTIATDAAATTMPDTLDGLLYRVYVGSKFCEDRISREAELRVHELEVSDIINPRDTTVCAGEPAYFEVFVPTYNRDQEELRYRWQIWNPYNSTWVNLNPVGDYNGVITSRLSISDVDGFNGMQFRAGVFTNECDTIFSGSATLTVEGPFVFGHEDDGHPQDTTVCYGEQVTFNANPIIDTTSVDHFGIRNDGEVSTIVYNWVYNEFGDFTNPKDVSTNTWTDGIPSGWNTTSLVIDNTTDELDGYSFWLELTSATCENVIRSLPAVVRVEGPLSFAVQPTDQTNCSDQGIIFPADVVNPGFGGEQTINYQWIEWDSLSNGANTDYRSASGIWTNVTNDSIYNGATSDSLSISDLYNKNGNRYALIATIDGCSFISSDTVRLGEEGPIVVNRDPVDIITCVGQPGGFGATAIDSTTLTDANLVYNWQVSTNRGIDWGNLTNTGIYSNIDTDTMDISNIDATMHGYRYRLAITNQSGSCDTVYSLPARIRAEGPIIFNAVRDTTICDNLGAELEATIDLTSTGTGVPILQWEVDVDGSGTSGGTGTFFDVPTDSIYDAINSNKLFIEKILEAEIIPNTYDLSTNLSQYDTLINLDNFDFRLRSTTELCLQTTPATYFYSDTITINTKESTLDECDFDLDGLNNLIDLDDDADGLSDSIEVYISTSTDPEDYISQFNTDTDNDGISDGEEDADGDTINNGEESDDDNGDGIAEDVDVFLGEPGATPVPEELQQDIFNGDPLDPCDPILSPTCIGVVLDIKVKLHGAMIDTSRTDGCNGCMRDEMRIKNLVPVNEPYTGMMINRLGSPTTEPAFVHVDDHLSDPMKGGGEVAPASLMADQPAQENDIVDWVFVELRSSLQLDSIIATRSGLLQRDGDVRDIDARNTSPAPDQAKFYDPEGYKYLVFDSTFAGEYYVSVRHRNHLGVMTNEAGLLSPKLTTVDFVDPQTNALGVHPQKMFTLNAVYDPLNPAVLISADSVMQAMWAGDLNSDRRVIYQGARNDVDEMFFNVIGEPNNTDNLDNYILPGYLRSDYNLDGNTIFQGPQNDRQMLIFNSILSFPDNREKFLANYVILEQLP